MLRRIFLLCVLAACGGDSPTEPETARLRFAIDGATCQGIGVLLMFVDGIQIGAEHVAAGQASGWHDVQPGRRSLGARMQDNSYTWPSVQYDIEAGLEYTNTLRCF